MFKRFKRRGQVLVFYALMIPLLFLFAGVGLDLGWYYLNVSRLQNAADAAALAGARTIIDSNSGKLKDLVPVLVSKLPEDNGLTDDGEPKVETTTETNTSTSTTESEEGTTITTTETTTTTTTTISKTQLTDLNWTDGDTTAKNYIIKNIGTTQNVQADTDETANVILDSWSLFKSDSDRQVVPDLKLVKVNGDFYYIVKLGENIRHFFMPGWFDGMDAKVVAIALLTKKIIPEEDEPPEELPTVDPIPRDPGKGSEQELPDGTDILTRTYNLEDITVMRNWEWQQNATDKQYESYMNRKKYSGKWNEYQDKTKDNKDKTKVVHYVEGNHYRTETVKVQPVSSDGTTTNGTDFDSLNLDFHPDVEYKFTEDWDIGYEMPAGLKQTYRSSYNGGYDLRIHSTFNFGDPYPVRSSAITEEDPEDALYVRIESEPIEPLSFKKQTFFSTVRQIFLNINKANTGVNDRPLVFFYDGPEQITANSEIRKSQPVILTLNADARVILFAPNSPVVIRGNGYKMQGFVIAKNFVQLTTEKDYNKVTEDGVTRYFDKKNPSTEYFYIEEEDTFVDSNGNVQTKPLSSNASREREGIEVPENTSRIQYPEYERVYKLETFNFNSTSYYDSFKIAELERHVYTYLDNYKDNGKTKSVDMFFTKIRSSWID